MDFTQKQRTLLLATLVLAALTLMAAVTVSDRHRQRIQAGARERCEAIHDHWDPGSGVCLQVVRP